MELRDVFISYSKYDGAYVDRLAFALEKRGLSCYFDRRDFVAGSNWQSEILTCIDNSSVVVLVLSHHSNQDENQEIAREIVYTEKARKILIPIKIDDVTPSGVIGQRLMLTHYFDAAGMKFDAQVARLADMIRLQISRQVETVPSGGPFPADETDFRSLDGDGGPTGSEDDGRARRTRPSIPWTSVVRGAVVAGALTAGLAGIVLVAVYFLNASSAPPGSQAALAALKAKQWDEAIALAAAAPQDEGWPFLVKAQADYCKYMSSDASEAQRAALLADLTRAAQSRDVLPEAEFRLGAQLHTGGALYDYLGQSTEPRAQELLASAARQGYGPAQVYLNAINDTHTAVPRLEAARTDSAANWPAGVYPLDCDHGLDLDVARWTNRTGA